MALIPFYTNKFKQDLKLCKKRNFEMHKIKKIMELLIDETILPAKNRDHVLVGNYKGRRECHVLSDWLLIYKIDKDQIIFERTGTHSDLFG